MIKVITERGAKMKVNVFGIWEEVKSYKEASEKVREFCYVNGFGASMWYSVKGTGLIEENGKINSHVSYNGRVWEGIDDNIVPRKEIVF